MNAANRNEPIDVDAMLRRSVWPRPTPAEAYARRAIRILSRCFWAAIVAIVAVTAWEAWAKVPADLAMYHELRAMK